MDKNAIKKYAVWARRELISRVSQKALQYGITEQEIVPANATSVNGVVLSAEEMQQRRALIGQINAKSYEQVMEEVAYTWFNRFIALRFMEVNGYLPSRVRVFTDENNAFNPQILTEAISLELDGLDMERVYALKDANDEEGLFKYLLIVQCNALSPILPKMFQRIADYTELLFPDNLLREGSAIQQMIELIPEEDWKDAVQIIGWLYQFYNIEPKAEVFAKNGKISKEEIPAATQLFTPDWIVRYMVENSLGRLWLEHLEAQKSFNFGNVDFSNFSFGESKNGDISQEQQKLKANWKYYLDEAKQEPEVEERLKELRESYRNLAPEQIKCIDPCSGSGHILAYMFDVLMQIYEAYGYTAHEAVRSIVENNIYGLDIDERAAQLAYFSVMMKARQYDHRFLTRKDEDGNPNAPQPHVYEIMESNGLDRTAIEHFVGGDKELKKAMDTLVSEMHDAKEYGSILNITQVDFDALYKRFDEVLSDISIYNITIERDLLPFVQIAETMAQRYDIVVTNPPYMGASNMNSKLNAFIKQNYADYKSDFFSAFVIRATTMTKQNGFCGFFTPYVWMFIQSYEKMRNYLYTNATIETLIQFEYSAFEEATVPVCTFAFSNRSVNKKGCYLRLTDFRGGMEIQRQKTLEALSNHACGFYYEQNTKNYLNVPGAPIAYWVSDDVYRCFSNGLMKDVADTKQGFKTGDNDRFLKLWFEVDLANSSYSKDFSKKWFPCTKGGEFRRWYGNFEYVVNWENDGFEIKHFVDDKGKLRSRPQNLQINFTKGLTWSSISSSDISFRYVEDTFMYESKGPIFIPKANSYDLLAYLNSCVYQHFIKIVAPTLDYSEGSVLRVPYTKCSVPGVSDKVENNISLSKQDWDSFETSWDFLVHPLVLAADVPDLNGGHKASLAECYAKWEKLCDKRFDQLKANEEELNRIFIDIYGLQDELTPEVEEKDVTVRKADLKRDIKSLISYAVGCMFGRYSLDVPGLAYAGGEWDDSQYTTFKADKDSIIPICDDEYFADDIVGRFIRFIEVVYGKDSLNDNLKFIADALGGSGQPKDVIRKYFMDEFYADHLKTYQKRPIYWLFDSGKKNGFKALVYMHRYAPDTIARMRTDYVHEQQARYRTAIADLEQRIASAPTGERVKLNKKLKTLQEQAAEIQGYEEKIHHLADQYISIDLDDGVKVNYAKFQDVLAKIK